MTSCAVPNNKLRLEDALGEGNQTPSQTATSMNCCKLCRLNEGLVAAVVAQVTCGVDFHAAKAHGAANGPGHNNDEGTTLASLAPLVGERLGDLVQMGQLCQFFLMGVYAGKALRALAVSDKT